MKKTKIDKKMKAKGRYNYKKTKEKRWHDYRTLCLFNIKLPALFFCFRIIIKQEIV